MKTRHNITARLLLVIATGFTGFSSLGQVGGWVPHEDVPLWFGLASSADGTKLAATVSNEDGLYTSTNSGLTWTLQGDTKRWGRIASSADGANPVMGVWEDRIYTPIDSGATGHHARAVPFSALTAIAWHQYVIPLFAMGVAGQSNCDGVWIQDRGVGAQPTFYLHDDQLNAPDLGAF